MHDKLQKLHSAISAVVGETTIESLTRRPAEKWSAAEILEHLNLTYLGTIKNLERRLSEGQPTSSPRRAFSLTRTVVTQLGLFPGRRKAPEAAKPKGTPPQQVRAEILQNLAAMDDLITRCESRFPSKKPIADHPRLGPLTSKEWRGFHHAHGLHHIKQIEALIQKRLI